MLKTGKLSTALFIVLTILLGCNAIENQFLLADAKKLLKKYDVSIEQLKCTQLSKSREGYCEFTVEQKAVSTIVSTLQKDLDAKRNPQASETEGMFSQAPCESILNPKDASVRQIKARTQFGGYQPGYDLPYLGPVYFEESTGRFCIALQYGYG